ncbi:hypothetical protein AB0O86_33775 [Streptomyces hirsutus]|uniref:hypothetical protein n=1 Tax=Streptomyces hirsutus TaxID=35620 RepID=UPI00341F09C1
MRSSGVVLDQVGDRDAPTVGHVPRIDQVQFAPSLRGLGHLRPQLPGLVGQPRFALVVLIGAVGGD